MPDLHLDLLIQHVAEAIGAARIAETAIGTDVVPNLSHLQRSHPQDVRKLLAPDRLFETRTLVDLEVLAATLEHAIRHGTTEEIVYDASPENVSNKSWTHRTRDGQTCDLVRALTVVDDLRERLQAIHDLLAARRVLERMNAEY